MPKKRPSQPDAPGDHKDRPPAEMPLSQDEKRRQQPQSDELPRGVEADGARPLGLREPRGNEPVADWKRRSLEKPQEEPKSQKSEKRARKTLHHGSRQIARR